MPNDIVQQMDLTKALAVYASLLSTAVFFWNVQKSRPKIRVKIRFGLEHIEDDPVLGTYVAIQNPSAHTVHITGVDILYRYQNPAFWKRIAFIVKHFRFPSTLGWVHCSLGYYDVATELPKSIEPGQSKLIFIRDEVMKEIISGSPSNEIMAKVQDALWQNTYSKKFKLDLPTFSRDT